MKSSKRLEKEMGASPRTELKLTAKVDTEEVDAAINKVEQLNDLLEKANSLVRGLALQEINLKLNVEV